MVVMRRGRPNGSYRRVSVNPRQLQPVMEDDNDEEEWARINAFLDAHDLGANMEEKSEAVQQAKASSSSNRGPHVREWAGTIGLSEWTEPHARAWIPHVKVALDLNCKDWIFQLEKGKDTGLYHFQVYLKCQDQCYVNTIQNWMKTSCKGLQFNHLSPCANSVALKEYAMKDDTRIDGPWGKDQARVEKMKKKAEEKRKDADMEEVRAGVQRMVVYDVRRQEGLTHSVAKSGYV